MNEAVWTGPGSYTYVVLTWKSGCEQFTSESPVQCDEFKECPETIEDLGDRIHRAMRLIAKCQDGCVEDTNIS